MTVLFEDLFFKIKDEGSLPGAVFVLDGEPQKRDLKQIGLFEGGELLLIRAENKWMIIKGKKNQTVYVDGVCEKSDLFAHLHPPDTLFAYLPSCVDVFTAGCSGKPEYIISGEGITFYGEATNNPIDGSIWRPSEEYEIENAFMAFLALQAKISSFHCYEAVCRQFFERLGTGLRIKKWDDLPEKGVFAAFQ